MSEQRCLARVACVLCLAAGMLAAPVHSRAAEAEELADPMRPPQVLTAPAEAGDPAQQAATEPRLQAIKREGKHHSAVINGRVVRVGDEVDGIRVTAISAGTVTINVEGKSSVLKLLGQDIKHNARKPH